MFERFPSRDRALIISFQVRDNLLADPRMPDPRKSNMSEYLHRLRENMKSKSTAVEINEV